MPRKKSRKKSKFSRSMFKLKGASAKLKVNAKKKKIYYYKSKIKPEKAKKLAASIAADIMGVPESSLKVRKPRLKYEFYAYYDLVVNTKFLLVRKEALGCQQEVAGAMIGKEIITPKKRKNVGKAIPLDIVELYEIERQDELLFDSKGNPAKSLERVVRRSGKKKATSAWIRKNPIVSGKYNSIDKIVRAYTKLAAKKPKTAKRVVENTLTFKKLEGYYIPTYYVKASAGSISKTMRVNAVNRNVALKV